MNLELPSRFRRLYPGDNLHELLEDFYPRNSVEVNGESFHKEELEQVCRSLEAIPDEFKAVDAFLVREPNNDYDANAVAVYIHEKKVGYIPKTQAANFSEFLKHHEGGIWVVAAVRFVSAIGQYRVRLFAKSPFSLDESALPIIDVAGFTQIDFDDEMDGALAFEGLSEHHPLIPWRYEQIGKHEHVSFCGPIKVHLERGATLTANSESDDQQSQKVIHILINGTRVGKIWQSDENYNLLDQRLSELGGLALSSMNGFADDTAKSYFWFTNDLKPKAEELLPPVEDWIHSRFHDDESDGGHTRF
jgi:hypothetical protein